MISRSKKRLIIIFVYLLIIGFLIFLISRRYLVGENCFDGKQNQDETGIDCGGVCEQIVKGGSFGKCEEKIKAKDIVMNDEDVHLIYGGENLYDLAIKISNPNELYGAKSFKYIVKLKNSEGNVIVEKEGENFILPLESKYLIEIGLNTKEKVASYNVSIIKSSVDWVKFTNFETPKITIQNQRFGLLGENDPNYAMAFGLMVNESLFDFNKIDINVVLKDSRGIPVAVNKTDKRTVQSGEKRDFTLIFPTKFPGGENIFSAEMQAEVNVFDNNNFMKNYIDEEESL